MLKVLWGNRLENLAKTLFAAISAHRAMTPADALRWRKCVVVPNRIVQGWLQQQFLFADPPGAIMADWDFPLLHVFVNDRLERACNSQGTASRDPASHPFGRDALTWRIFDLLHPARLSEPEFAPLVVFLRPTDAPRLEQRRYKLARRLATLYDDYCVYRPDTLLAWESGREKALPPDMAWQPALWRRLVAGDLREKTYLAAFARMARDPQALRFCGAPGEYRHIHVFGVSMMPRVYIHFFETLSKLISVTFYALNPSESDWFTVTQTRDSLLEGRLDEEADFAPANVFLGQQGRGNRNFLVELLDRTDGQAEAEACFDPPAADSPLHALQAAILRGSSDVDTGCIMSAPPPFSSIQTHVCHSPLREIEVLHDHLLRWFSESAPALQPRQVQVQVTDMSLYAPYIRAVFASREPHAPDAIPYAVADRIPTAESSVTAAFLQILHLGDSRFTSVEVLDLLHCRAIADTFGLTDSDIPTVIEWCRRAGIRWGRDAIHRQKVTGVAFTAATTWRHGLDRLFTGYAYAQLKPAAGTDIPLPCDCISEDAPPVLGRFAAFVTILADWSANSSGVKPLGRWIRETSRLVDKLFTGSNENYLELNAVRAALTHLEKSVSAAGTDASVTLATVRDFLTTHLKLATGGDDPGANTVVFSALRPGSSVPRRIICLLGMADRVFPRHDHRPSYDLLRRAPRFGDRSLRQEDRMAFLEAVMSARERLYISYTGYSARDNSAIPPAIPLAELHEALARLGFGKSDVPVMHHRLSPHHPRYFQEDSGALFSYSAPHFRTAVAMQAAAAASQSIRQGDWHTQLAAAPSAPAEPPGQVSLDELASFLRNPAKVYYNKALGVWLEPVRDASPDENEPFTIPPLERYKIVSRLLSIIVATDQYISGGVNDLYQQLLNEGNLPLGRNGRQWYDAQLRELHDFLAKPCSRESDLTLLELLRPWHNGLKVTHKLLFGRTTLIGQLVMPATGMSLRPELRYASDKTSDRLCAWLHHLFACACGKQWATLYLRRDKTKTFPPFADAGQAYTCLERLLQCYIIGTAQILPFVPEVSAAYFKSRNADAPGTVDQAALEKARERWLKKGYQDFSGEIEDPYYRQAFGDAGPFADAARFAELAHTIIGQHKELSS